MRTLALLVAALATITSGCVIAPHVRYVASEARIRIVRAGIPVADAIVAREVAFGAERKDPEVQRAVTDKDGWANLPAITRTGLVHSIGEWSFSQKWTVKVGAAEHMMWNGWKSSTKRFSERSAIPYTLHLLGEGLVVQFDLEQAGPGGKR